MQRKNHLAVLFLATVCFIIPTLAVRSQTPPASTYKAGFWQPTARIDAKLPMTIEIVNQSQTIVDYGFTEDAETDPVSIPIGATIKIDRITLPSYLSITSNVSDPQIDLRYEVTATNNIITIIVKPVVKNEVGNGAIDIQETGAIYVY
jgi:hypothetical protein